MFFNSNISLGWKAFVECIDKIKRNRFRFMPSHGITCRNSSREDIFYIAFILNKNGLYNRKNKLKNTRKMRVFETKLKKLLGTVGRNWALHSKLYRFLVKWNAKEDYTQQLHYNIITEIIRWSGVSKTRMCNKSDDSQSRKEKNDICHGKGQVPMTKIWLPTTWNLNKIPFRRQSSWKH